MQYIKILFSPATPTIIRVALAVWLTIGGCSPLYTSTNSPLYQTPTNQHAQFPPPRKLVKEAENAARTVYEDNLSIELGKPIVLPDVEVNIHWVNGVDIFHDGRLCLTGKQYEYPGECLVGLFVPVDWPWNNSDIYVVWEGSISQSSFAHELVHYYKWARSERDENHDDTNWWPLVKDAQEAIEDTEDYYYNQHRETQRSLER